MLSRTLPTQGLAMRYFIQFVIPAIIFVSLVYMVGRRRGLSQADGEAPILSNTTFVLVLVIGATFTVALLFGLAQL